MSFETTFDAFPRAIRGQRVVVHVSRNASDRLPDPDRQWVCSVRLSVREVEDRADDALRDARRAVLGEAAELDARPVGDVSGPGYWEGFVYADGDVSDALSAAARDVCDACEIQADAHRDPSAEVYFEFLAPSEVESLLITNRRKLAGRPAAGEEARLAHAFRFSSKDDRSRFAEEVARYGFELEYPPEDPDEDADEDFELTILRTDMLDVAELDQLVRRLFKAATGRAGRYDGWKLRR